MPAATFQSKLAHAETPLVLERTMIGEHPAIAKLRKLIERVAMTEATVLITGESGTGKEVVAHTIHAMSARCNQPFVAVNCAAIPNDLLESEMFGHERGAFTGATGPRQGLLASADRGTIFLDEIGEMPHGLQAKLLRVLEDGMVRPVGSGEDLFYRLQVVPIFIPPLRDHRSDIPLLIEYFVERIRTRNPSREIEVSREAMVALWSHDWPGNIRELENMIERLAIMCDDSIIGLSTLPENLLAGTRPAIPHIPETLGEEGLDLNRLVRDLEGRLINDALKQTGGNKQAAARLLGLKRTTFSAKLRRCGVITSNAADDDERD